MVGLESRRWVEALSRRRHLLAVTYQNRLNHCSTIFAVAGKMPYWDVNLIFH